MVHFFLYFSYMRMLTSKQFSMPLLLPPARSRLVQRLLGAVAALGLVGFADSAYLTIDHYYTLPLPCSITHGCETVLTSPYAMVGTIPLALFGVAYYLVVMFFALYLYTEHKVSRRQLLPLFALTLVGFLMSVIFIGIQLFLIHAFCMYCALSALCTLLLLICGSWLVRVQK